MKDEKKTNEQLLSELAILRRRIAVLEELETKHKQMEERFKKSERFNLALFRYSPIKTIVVDRAGRVIKFNKAKWKSGDRLPKIGDVMYRDYAGKHEIDMHTELMECIRSGKTKTLPEVKYDDKFLHIMIAPFPEGAIITSQDITESKKAEEEMARSEREFRSLARSALVGIYRSTLTGEILFVNDALVHMLGYASADEVIQQKAVVYYKDSAKRQELLSALQKAGRVMDFETTLLTKKGETRQVLISAILEGDQLIGTILDITERKREEEEKKKLQAQLIQSEKMAVIGTLASGIAHEFNNLLQIMKGHTELAQKTKKAEDMTEALDIVINTSDRAAKIIRDLLTFSRQEDYKKELCDIIEPIESVLSLIEDQLKKHNIRVVRKCERTPLIEVNIEEMKQVFLNMIANARDAMLPEGGRLEICIKPLNKNIEISFSDTGIGIEEENMSKVFEPFYTTKGAMAGKSNLHGTGLGLPVSYGIVKRHGGMIEVKSKAGKGTTFTIILPVKKVEIKKRQQVN